MLHFNEIDLPSLQTIILGNNAFAQSESTVLESIFIYN